MRAQAIKFREKNRYRRRSVFEFKFKKKLCHVSHNINYEILYNK